MKISAREAWVTSAVTAVEARSALVLCFSLRASYTTRKLLVIASPTLSEKLRDALEYAFDRVYFLEEDRKPECLTLADFAKLSTIGVCQEFEKYIYLLPNSVVMKNADELFDDDHLRNAEGQLLPLTNFMMEPSLKKYKMFLSELRQRGKVDQTSLVLGPWLKKRFTELVPIPLCGSLGGATVQNYFLKRESKVVPIVNLDEDVGMTPKYNSLGLLQQEAATRWMNIFEAHIEPMLKDPSCSVFSKIPKKQYGNENEPIAVIGMSGRLPKCENIHEFWNLLLSGEDGTSSPPSFRWKENERSKPFPDDKINAGFLPCPVDEFDAKFFGISPKEAAFMDPQHRILLEVVWEALEDACIDPFSLNGTAGSVFVGSWTHDYKHILEHSGNDEYMRVYFGTAIDAATARISNCLKLTGPSVATEGGCAASMVAVHLACNSLRLGQTNIALAAGVNLMVNPFCNGWMPMVTSEEGHCKTFCEKADGFARAEGCCALVLKRLSDAVRDGDNIWALIKGTGTSQEGTSNCLGTPTILGESLAMTRALHDAGVKPEDVSFVETHGTGTPVGDPLEIAAIAKAYHTKKRKEPLIIGSVKTNVGHTESCSGITGIIKTILSMHHGVIPPHINFEKLNPAIDLEAIPATIALQAMEWTTSGDMPKRAGVSSFGISGIDAHVILEETPQPSLYEEAFFQFERPTSILKVSAKSSEALEDLLNRTQEHVTVDNSSTLQDICYSGNVGRADFNFRAVITAKSKKELVDRIQQNSFLKGEVPSSRGKVCFLFTGQGSQYPGMAKQLYETCPTFRLHFDYCEGILRSSYNLDLKKVLWDNDSTEDLSRTLYSQTSIFVLEYALLKLFESWGVRPDYVLGHSLGELAAAVCAEILSVEDAIMLVAERSILINKLPEGKMLVIRADKEQVASLQKMYFTQDSSKLEVAAVNSPEQTVVAGDSEDILGFAKFCKNNNFKCTILGATHAFHSRHMDPMLNAYRDVAKKITSSPQSGSCEFISGMQGSRLEKSEVNPEYWVKHTRNAVSFLDASKEAIELGCRIFVEVGPQPILCNLITVNSEDTDPLCLPLLKKGEEDWTCLLQSLGALYLQGIPVNWNGLDSFFSRKKVRSLPHYPFQRKKVWAEKLIDSSSSIHPLLGTSFKNATSTKLFQSFIKLPSHKYLQDHAIGMHILFPGTGYLEMCLKAGIDTTSFSSDLSSKAFQPVKVENLIIKVPLQLTDSKRTQLQTVLDTGKLLTESASDLSIKIFERTYSESAESSWQLHAEATFSQTPTPSDTSVPKDMISQVTDLEECEGSSELAHQFYEYMASTGISFGPSFRSIQNIRVGGDGKSSLATIRIPPQTRNQYIVHPVAMDAMGQAYFLMKFVRNEKFKLLLPVKIGRFVWLGNESPVEECFLYAYADVDDGDDSCTTLLLSKDGKVIAKMSGFECAQTTLKQVEGMLEEKVNFTPGIWEEVWRPSVGHMQHRIDMELSSVKHSYDESFVQEMRKKFGCPNEEVVTTFRSLNKLAYYNILRALYECGLQLPGIGSICSRRNILESLQIQSGFQGLIGSYLEILAAEGVLKRDLNEEDRYTVIGKAPPLEQLDEALCKKELTTDLISKFPSAQLLLELGKNLTEILRSGKSALPILFPEGENQYLPIAGFYREYNGLFGLPDLISDVLLKWLENVQASHMKDPQGKMILRVLEIGGGTGSFTACLIEVLDKLGIQFEYTFTDISSAFFAAAQARFQKWAKSIRFMKFNIEEDPLTQALIPEYFDYICGEQVVHATKNIRTSLSNVAMLLRVGGRLDLVEIPERNTIITYLFGVLEGFWRFEDTELRKEHCQISVNKWKRVLEQEGLEMVAEFPSAKMSNLSLISSRKMSAAKSLQEPSLNSSTPLWLLFHQEDSPFSNFLLENITAKTRRQLKVVSPGKIFSVVGDNITTRISFEEDFSTLLLSIVESGSSCLEGILYCWTLNEAQSSQEEILQPYFYLAKAMSALGLETGTHLVSFFNGIAAVEGYSPGNIHQSTAWAFARSVSSEHPDLDCRCIDIGNSDSTLGGMMQIFHEIWNFPEKKGPTHVAFCEGVRYEPKLQPFRDHPKPLEIPPVTSRFRLQLPDTRAIEDIQIVPLEDCGVGEHEVEVQVKAAALNFKDVLVVLQATEQLKNKGVGVDIAGVIKRVGCKVTKWSVGDSVFCCSPNNSPLHSHTVLHEDDVFAMDHTTSWFDAATLPVAFLTTYHGLLEVAKIRSGDNVLIHTASGGVGLCALQLCNMVGANVICTAGSKRKRKYLRSLGIRHIFDSRIPNYGKKILEATGGHGVDVVLNSLTSEGFKEETLICCAIGARFVEMSKLNVWTLEEVAELRPDVEYTIIDVLKMKTSHSQKILNVLTELLREGKVKSLPYVPFDLVNIREALTYLQRARHIGKIVCMMPELKQLNGENVADTEIFHDRGTYLITGGRVGGIGFAVCKWMVEKGAKYILLATRSSLTEKARKEIFRLNSEYSARVTPVQFDVGDDSQCRNVLENEIVEMRYPPLRGVMHCAGVLNDGLIQNQDWEGLSIPFRAKVEGTLNLHELTKDKNLEHFVIFSSIVGLLGPSGQSNH